MTLPQGWVETTIGDVTTTKLGKMLDATKNKGEPVAYLRNVNVRWGAFDLSDLLEMRATAEEREELAVRDGDLFVCEGGEPGRCAVWRGGERDLVFQKAIHRVRPLDAVDADYIAAFFTHLAAVDGLSHQFTGTTIKHLPQVALQRITVPLPPVDEQRRIVAKLHALTVSRLRARNKVDRIWGLAPRQRLAILRSAISGSLTAAWRGDRRLEPVAAALNRFPAPKQGRGGREATDKVIPGSAGLSINDPKTELPHGWAWVPLLRIAKQETGHTPSRSKPSYWDGGVPWIGIRDAGAHHGRVIDTTMQTISEEGLANSSARLLPAGTVCLSRTASVGYVTTMGRSMATSQDFATWTCTEALEPGYLMYALMAEGDDIRKFGMGSTHTTIYFPEIRALHIALPPIDEQREIVKRLNSALARADCLEAEATRARALLDRLEAAILAKAFRGELVPQDPNDEPASVLLDRIRAERAAAPKPKRGRARKAVA